MYRVLVNYGTEGWQFLFDDPEALGLTEDAMKLLEKKP